ncbi:MAG: pyrroline-5-carboxylate reductase [Gammaproteobacteria bacterium]|nr:pyrroline-5-carboxylate reductase [Gammaproteobacteria bacterium]
MTQQQNIVFIGAGNMASSIIGGLVNQGTPAQSITVTDAVEAQRLSVAEKFGVNAVPENAAAATSADVIVLAVKPNVMQSVCQDIAPVLDASTLLLSIAAGIRCDSIKSWTGNVAPVVRCMPNTPALVSAGASALYADEACSDTQRDSASTILSAAGVVCWVDEEAKLDAVTALSGSGPAYFFHLIECMTDAAVEMGLSPEIAETLAIETAYGAASMARRRELPPATLRENVTSKGGTTAAALASFADDQLPAIVARAMEAARARANELGKLTE